MKKVLYICLAVLLLAGVGVGVWFMRSGNKTADNAAPSAVDVNADNTSKTISEIFQSLPATKHLAEYVESVPALAKTDTGTNVIFFAPTKAAVDTFTKDTALSLGKFLPYHVVVSDAVEPIVVTEGTKLATVDGQELDIVKVDGDLYVRDAKGNDARLRKPVQAKNGKMYIIDKVLLTQ